MQKIIHLSAIALLAAIGFSSCKKEKAEEITFVNRATEEVTMDIYASYPDYASGQTPMLRKVLPANDKLLLPASTFTMGTTYYIDWYNEDYSLNNWFSDELPNGVTTVAYTPRSNNLAYYTSGDTKSGAKNVFLNGNGSGTTWNVIDAFQYSQSTGFVTVWNQLPDSQHHQSVIVSKDFVAQHRYQATDGSMKNAAYQFKVHNTGVGYIEFMGKEGNSAGYMISGRVPYSKKPDYASTSTDSLLATLPNSEIQFLMVKQK
ncbi:MAG: hypothetical protein EOP51_00015 [Sphingobacteriales bacterium]|nr:MAG: hypothetical protein EOP51_00015 [Sphingobacteriales bacterium]